MGTAIPEASRVILQEWQVMGMKFIWDGEVFIKNLGFDDATLDYSIPEQPIPEGMTVDQVRAMWEQGLELEFNSDGCWWRVSGTFCWFGRLRDYRLVQALRIPTQPIPEKLLQEPVTELPVEKYVAGGEPKWEAPKPMAFTLSLESDPGGLDPHAPGAKLDAGKNRLGLVLGGFARALEEVGKVGTYGANKYSDNGWKKVEKGAARYDDAMLRHWLKRAAGEAIDPETGLLHQAQVVWNALAVLEAMLEEFDG